MPIYRYQMTIEFYLGFRFIDLFFEFFLRIEVNRSRFISRSVVYNSFPGDNGGGVTPDPIPNSEVKPSSADDTTIGGKVGHRQGFFSSSKARRKNSAKPGWELWWMRRSRISCTKAELG